MIRFASKVLDPTVLFATAQVNLNLSIPRTMGARRAIGFACLNQKFTGGTVFGFNGKLMLKRGGAVVDAWEMYYGLTSLADLGGLLLVNALNPVAIPPFMVLPSIGSDIVPPDSALVSLKRGQTLVLVPNYTSADFDEVSVEGNYACTDEPLAVLSVRNCG